MLSKRIIIVVLLAICCQIVAAGDFESAASAVGNMRVGWNLGNTLESNSGDVNNMWIEAWTQRRPNDYETAWGQAVTKPELLKMFKEAGFNAIRIPVTWYPHMEATFKGVKWNDATQGLTAWDTVADPIGTKIQAAWMKRVHEVVDYVVSQGMYCILNVHHDTGDSNTAWLVASEADYAKQKERFEELWRQIAEEFKDYDEHLLFEGYNEMLDPYGSWCFASFATSGSYNSTVATSAYKAINSYAQSFVDAVRSTGGNNLQRNLIVSTYGACCGSGTWNTHLADPLKKMALPADSVTGHLIFEVHSYFDVKDLSATKSSIDQTISSVKSNLASKGAPVIFGEWGSTTENCYDNYRGNLLAFARYFVEKAKASGMGMFYWMGLSDGKSRSVPEFSQADVKDAIIRGYYGDGGFSGIGNLTGNPMPAEYYNLAGRRLTVPQKGINVIRQAGEKTKKMVKR